MPRTLQEPKMSLFTHSTLSFLSHETSLWYTSYAQMATRAAQLRTETTPKRQKMRVPCEQGTRKPWSRVATDVRLNAVVLGAQ